MVAKHASHGILGKFTKMDASGKLNVSRAAKPASNSKRSDFAVNRFEKNIWRALEKTKIQTYSNFGEVKIFCRQFFNRFNFN